MEPLGQPTSGVGRSTSVGFPEKRRCGRVPHSPARVARPDIRWPPRKEALRGPMDSRLQKKWPLPPRAYASRSSRASVRVRTGAQENCHQGPVAQHKKVCWASSATPRSSNHRRSCFMLLSVGDETPDNGSCLCPGHVAFGSLRHELTSAKTHFSALRSAGRPTSVDRIEEQKKGKRSPYARLVHPPRGENVTGT